MSEDIKYKLGQRIKKLRRRKKLTQAELAEKAGIDYKYYQRIEGKNPPNLKIDTIQKISTALSIKPELLFR